ncbi:aspartyl protease family protein [Synechococcus sp. GFB01]|uniref:aspartyl protease family protein n=1 Tax=Synechococcus sp. GFB01 TaxID=1662190 RepID=UPI00128AF74D|nr:aspartyl protease family protein [Synechococcus sp. GFB01]
MRCRKVATGAAAALAMDLLTAAIAATATAATAAALIQVRGTPLPGGTPSGSAQVVLERAAGGDTPVLTFSSARGAVRLLVDTGASSHLVTPALAGRLGLASEAVAPEAFGLAGAGAGCEGLQVRRAVLPPLRLEGGEAAFSISGAGALVLEVGGLPPGIDGVLGAPLLRRLPLWIDPAAERLALGERALRAADQAAATRAAVSVSLPLRWQKGVPLLPLSTTTGPVQALADTGAEGLFLTPALAVRLRPQGRATPLRLTGFCGDQTASRVRLSGLGLPGSAPRGGTDLAAPLEGIVTVNPIFQALGVEAIVGQELLRRRSQLWRLDATPPLLLLW